MRALVARPRRRNSRSTSLRYVISAAAYMLLASCAGGSGAPSCRVEVVKLEKWQLRPGALDAEYRVKGQAGAPGVVSLVAKLGSGDYITGPGVQVGPGPFIAIVELKLTAPPPELLTLLEVGATRCSDSAPKPQ